MSNFFDLVDKLNTAINDLDLILQGGENQTVNISGVNKSSISKAIADSFVSLNALTQSRKAFRYVANISSPTDVLVDVWGDAADKNGTYAYNGSAWVKTANLLDNIFPSNALVDPRMDLIIDNPSFGGFNHFKSWYKYRVIVNSPNSPYAGKSIGRAVLDGAEAQVYRDIDLTEIGLSGYITVLIDHWSDLTQKVSLFFRDENNNLIGSSKSIFPAAGGFSSVISSDEIPSNAKVLTVGLIGKGDLQIFGIYCALGLRPPQRNGELRSKYISLIETAVDQQIKIDLGNLAIKNNANEAKLLIHEALLAALPESPNILFDPFNEWVSVAPDIGGYYHLKVFDKNTLKTSSNSPYKTPVLTTSDPGVKFADRYFNLEASKVFAGEKLYFRGECWSSNGATWRFYFRRDDHSLLTSSSYPTAVAAGYQKTGVIALTIPVEATQMAVRLEVASGDFEAISYQASKTAKPAFSNQTSHTILTDLIKRTTAQGAGLVINNELVVDNQRLSPDGWKVSSAAKLNDNLYEFVSSGSVYRVNKLLGLNNVIKVPKDKKVNLVLCNGQSLSVGGNSSGTVDIFAGANVYQNQILMLNGADSIGPGFHKLTDSEITALVPLVNTAASSTPGLSALLTACRMGSDKTYIFASHGISGKSIGYLKDPANPPIYNAKMQVAAAKRLVEMYGLTISPEVVLFWSQGEGEPAESDYYNEFNSMISDYNAFVKLTLGIAAAVICLPDQVSRFYTKQPAQGQFLSSVNNRNCVLTGPKGHIQIKYNANSELANGDYTHLTKKGYFLMGCYWGQALFNLHSKGWRPIEPTSINVSKNQIVVSFNVPCGKLFVDPLLVVDHLGFTYSDSANNSIVSATLISDNSVKIVMSADIETALNRKLSLGMTHDSTVQYLATQLRDQSRVYVPELDEYLDNWACYWSLDI